jgi:hypothetical protein
LIGGFVVEPGEGTGRLVVVRGEVGLGGGLGTADAGGGEATWEGVAEAEELRFSTTDCPPVPYEDCRRGVGA